MIKKILCLLIAAVFCMGVLVSCTIENGGEGEQQSQSESPDVQDTTNTDTPDGIPAENKLPDINYGGKDYTVLTRETYYNADFEAKDTATDNVEAAVYARNSYVSNKYGVNIKVAYFKDSSEKTSGTSGDSAVGTAMTSGENPYDIIATHGRYAIGYATNDYCYNWNSEVGSSVFNLYYDWWSQGARECFTLNDRIYFMTGDICHLTTAGSYCLMANASVLGDEVMNSLYDDVKAGTWTFEKMSELALQYAKDDGDGKWVENGKDRLGYVTNLWGGSYCSFFAAGCRIVLVDEINGPQITITQKNPTAALEKFFTLVNNERCYLGAPDYSKNIQNGTYVFMDIVLDNIAATVKGLNEYPSYGILPYPKTAEIDNYVSHTAGEYSVLIIPKNVADPERTAVITEALAQGGRDFVIDEYYDKVILNRTTNSAKDKEMIAIIEDSRIYDLGYYYSGLDADNGGKPGISNLLYMLAKNGKAEEFTSYYSGAVGAATAAFQKLNTAYSK